MYTVPEALANIGLQKAIRPMLNCLFADFGSQNNWEQRIAVILALQNITSNKTIETFLLTNCSNRNWFIRSRVIEGLYQIRSTKAVAQYRKMLKDPNELVRSFAFKAIGDVAGDSNFPKSTRQKAVNVLLRV